MPCFPLKRLLQLSKEHTNLQEFSSDQAPVWKVETVFWPSDIMSCRQSVTVSA